MTQRKRPPPAPKPSFSIPLFPTLVFLVTVLMAWRQASAASFNEKCPNLAACVKAVSELTGQKYVYDKNIKDIASTATANLELTKDNAEELFSYALSAEGFSRVPMAEPDTYTIQRARDARDQALPIYRANQTTTPSIPNTYDLVQLTYQLANEAVEEHIARNLRSFMPANSRIVADPVTRSIIIVDTARNVKRLIPQIRDLDRKPSAALKARWKEMEQERKKARDAEPRKKDSAS